MKKIAFTVLAALALIGPATATSHAATITQIVAASGGEFDSNRNDYDILLNAVLAADLADALNNPDDEFTVFAPTDRAFIRLAKDLGFEGSDEAGAWGFLVGALTELGNGDPIPVLTQVLLYHVSAQTIRPIDLIFFTLLQTPIQTLQGGTIRPFFLQLIDNEPDLANPWVIWPFNIIADNGRIHSINRVLIPLDLP